ncbi:zinc finger protein 667-like [Mauremys mutica]|uniref:zinc finger protein 667-like n=1 Tax=Mauremys mutica TaxID=74926 RepID=UPI001D16A898|nr:zinc finger protein 667-like [Mauremys mutica]
MLPAGVPGRKVPALRPPPAAGAGGAGAERGQPGPLGPSPARAQAGPGCSPSAGSGREAAPGRQQQPRGGKSLPGRRKRPGPEPSPAMAAAGPAQLQVAFEDVALYFTREEWELLSQPEKQLYRDQMLRNYQALVSLGYSGSTPDLIYRIELGEAELWIRDAEKSRQSSGPESPSSGES